MHPTKQQLIAVGLPMLLEHGYNDLGLTALLTRARVPKGSFYHHFRDKDAFALAVLDAYMTDVHAVLDETLGDASAPPLDRIRMFFAAVAESYRQQGYMGCLIGGLGQELSGVSETFRQAIAACFASIGDRLAGCLAEAQAQGDLPPGADPQELGALLVDCWEGAALRSRLRGDSAPLGTMVDFFLAAVARGE